ncbi:hypothetical protein [Lysobacter gummosus]|uniref:hypothetical protein n=1 Tax=Lysobacter gummosus TaxID=262324 RepID=UPI003634B425
MTSKNFEAPRSSYFGRALRRFSAFNRRRNLTSSWPPCFQPPDRAPAAARCRC